jgi:hypothetical protein
VSIPSGVHVLATRARLGEIGRPFGMLLGDWATKDAE